MKTMRMSVLVYLCCLFTYGASPIYRTTHKGSQVKVERVEFTTDQWLDIGAAEREQLNKSELYLDSGTFRIVVNASAWHFARNCFDFAWEPFMSCCPLGSSISQPEAFFMQDTFSTPRKEVSANWRDGSMLNVIDSIVRPVNPDTGRREGEYIFNQDELNALRLQYSDPTPTPIGLPVCPLNNLTTEEALHSGILVGTLEVSDNRVAGIYWSKWGNLGLYQHRWGDGFLPDAYLRASIPFFEVPADTLKVFAPSWSGAGGGGYIIYHSAWGLGSPPESVWPQGE
jgi:hypothetical protein